MPEIERNYHYPPDETVSYEYQVLVTPQADESKAEIRAPGLTGSVKMTKQLVKKGNGDLDIPLTDFTIKDSPLSVEFSFKKGDKPPIKRRYLAALAEAAPGAIDAPPQAGVGETVKLKVAKWVALVYDLPGRPNPLDEDDPSRVAAKVKQSVQWRVEYDDKKKDLDQKGEEVDLELEDEHGGKDLKITAWVGDKPSDRAQTTIHVIPDEFILALEIKTIGGTPAQNELVQVIDREKNQPVGDPVRCDDDGKVFVPVPENKEYDLRIVCDDPPDRNQVTDDDTLINNLLICRFTDIFGVPVANETVKISGPSGDLEAPTDEDGCLDLHLDPGLYDLRIKDETFKAHTVLVRHLQSDSADRHAYVVGDYDPDAHQDHVRHGEVYEPDLLAEES
ncbi:MAG TPA: hypothetical protein VFF73_31440 [Planctomycetota bacterium]|nr:hypothetical protein [Planctomycetota bacterium]